MTHHIDQTFTLLNRALQRDNVVEMFEKHADLIDGERVIPVGTAADLIVDHYSQPAPSAADEIRAAIDKLEREKAASTSGPWSARHHPTAGVNVHYIDDSAGREVATFYTAERRHDRDLLLTLSRTIDAQLAILRAGLSWWGQKTDAQGPLDWQRNALALARAINGGTK